MDQQKNKSALYRICRGKKAAASRFDCRKESTNENFDAGCFEGYSASKGKFDHEDGT
jgi:hypothetical protein